MLKNISKTRHLGLYTTVFVFFVLFAFAWFLQKVFSGAWVLPQSLALGPLTIHYYGITMALAVGGAWWFAQKRSNQYGIAQADIDVWALWVIGGGFLGARLYHVFSSFSYYASNPKDILKVWNGGLSIFGAMLGGFIVLTVYAYTRTLKQCPKNPGRDFLDTLKSWRKVLPELGRVLDWLAPSFILGQILGRFGNLFNYEAYGYPTQLPWKMFVPEVFRASEFINSNYFHPLFLYEQIGNVIVLAVLLHLANLSSSEEVSKNARPNISLSSRGRVFFTYIILYNALRFGLEHLRVDSTFLSHGIRLNAVVSGVLCVTGIVGLCSMYIHEKKRRNNLE